MFALASKCFPICLQVKDPARNQSQNLRDIVQLEGEGLQKLNQAFATCMRECTVGYIQTREFVRRQFMEDIDKVVEGNNEIYRSFGTGFSTQ